MAHSIVYFVCTIYFAAADGVVRLDLLPSRYALIQIAITFIRCSRIRSIQSMINHRQETTAAKYLPPAVLQPMGVERTTDDFHRGKDTPWFSSITLD